MEDHNMTEKEKCLAGLLYDTSDPELVRDRLRAHCLCSEFNRLTDREMKRRTEILRELFPDAGEGCFFQGPLQVDYGYNLHVGKRFYANFNFVALDCCPIHVGDDVMFGPNCSLYTPIHPLLPEDRNIRIKPDGTLYNLEYARPIRIGNSCWIAGSVSILGGVTIGDGCVIGAGSVVTRDIPSFSLAVGNPCRVIRSITAKDAMEFVRLPR